MVWLLVLLNTQPINNGAGMAVHSIDELFDAWRLALDAMGLLQVGSACIGAALIVWAASFVLGLLRQ